jgi:phosphohistidine phosphatase
MTIYLVQHGKAKTKQEDPERPLNNEGIVETNTVLQFLKKQNVKVVSIIHSGKLRAENTAEILLEGLSSENGLIQMNGLNPNDDVSMVYNFIVKQNKDYMFVGHLPFMNKLSSLLLTGSENLKLVQFKNSCIVCFKEENNEDNFTLNWMVYPELLQR